MHRRSVGSSDPRLGIALFLLAAVLLVALLVPNADQRVDPWHGRSSVQPMDVTLESLGPDGRRRATDSLYERGWWTLQPTPDGFVLTHRR